MVFVVLVVETMFLSSVARLCFFSGHAFQPCCEEEPRPMDRFEPWRTNRGKADGTQQACPGFL